MDYLSNIVITFSQLWGLNQNDDGIALIILVVFCCKILFGYTSAHQKYGDNKHVSLSYYLSLQNHVLWCVKIPMHVQASKLSLIFHCHE